MKTYYSSEDVLLVLLLEEYQHIRQQKRQNIYEQAQIHCMTMIYRMAYDCKDVKPVIEVFASLL